MCIFAGIEAVNIKRESCLERRGIMDPLESGWFKVSCSVFGTADKVAAMDGVR